MKMSHLEKQITQVGTCLNESGESDSTSVFNPNVSGRGTIRQNNEKEKVKEMKKVLEKESDGGVDSPSVLGSRSLSIGSNLSVLSGDSVESGNGSAFWQASRKRDREELRARSGSDYGDAMEDEPVAKVATPRRGRGRPPTTGQYVGLAQAKRELVAAQRAQMEFEVEQEVSRRSQYLRTHEDERMSESSVGEKDGQQFDDVTSADIVKRVVDSVAIVQQVATKSKNLKGTFVRSLKDAASCIKVAVEVLQSRTTSDETKKLQADNNRLQKEVAELKKEMADIRAQMMQKSFDTPSEKKKDVSQEEMTQAIMLQVGGMVNARLEAMQDRLLPEKRMRPPLAADRRNAEMSATSSAASALKPQSGPPSDNIEEPAAGPSQAHLANKRRGSKAKKAIPATPASSELQSLPAALTPMSEEWTTVARRGLKKKNKMTPASQPQQVQSQAASQQQRRPQRRQMQKAAPRLRPPRSSAVVISLKPGSAEKGVTYASALAEARTKVDLAGLGISALRFRTAATGARILEIPGTTSGEKADSLADKLREVFNAEDVHVSRPIKSAELRISGLDDSVTAEEVAAAVAKVGACPVDAVKAGTVRRHYSGLGAIVVRCPISVARKVSDSGRVLVGWVAAQVKLLPQRQMQCFRCHELGHVREQCRSDVDRSDKCYRCGKAGHKANECSTAKAHCTLCASASKPAEHRIGSRACAPPPKRNGRTFVAAARSQPQTPHPPMRDKEVRMEVQQ